MKNLKKNNHGCFVATLFLALLFSGKAEAQEYGHEIGAALGTSFYMGDANKTKLFRNSGIAAGAMYRYNLNMVFAIKANLLAGTVSGDTRNSGNAFPDGGHASFKRTFADAGAQLEFNFLPYSDEFAYMDAKRIAPYVFTGVGTTVATGSEPFFGINIPVGVGVKYKLKKRVNVGFEFSVRKLFGDDFDVTDAKTDSWNLDAPYGIQSSILKNKDWYSMAVVFLTWDFGLRNDPCCN